MRIDQCASELFHVASVHGYSCCVTNARAREHMRPTEQYFARFGFRCNSECRLPFVMNDLTC